MAMNNTMAMVLSLLLVVVAPLAVSADFAVFTNFNNGVVEPGLFCRHDEWNAVLDTMDNAIKNRGRTQAPASRATSAPTKAATRAPMLTPTSAATRAPTLATTTAPTKDPTKAPTNAPIATSTFAPTFAPTLAPTEHPTFAPQEQAHDPQGQKKERRLRLGQHRQGRHLKTAPLNWCRDACSSIGSGYCHFVYPKCKKHNLRRTQEVDDADIEDQEEETVLQPSSRYLKSASAGACAQDITAINASLNDLVFQSNLTSECQALVNAPRNLTCVEVVDCTVHDFSLGNADTDKTTVGNYTTATAAASGVAPTICSNTTITFRAEAAFCVDNVQFYLTGPNKYSFKRKDIKRPFFLFAHSGPYWQGSKLAAGNYTLTAVSNGDKEMTKTLRFAVNDC